MNLRFQKGLGLLTLAISLCATVAGAASDPKVQKLPFGKAGGKDVDLYVLTNASGMTAKIMTYGATVTELDVPDRNGKLGDVVLGFDSLDGYLSKKDPYFGAVVGRVGNRIAKGRFTLDGKAYQLATNDGPNHLHGGLKGFDKVVWDAKVVRKKFGPSVEFTYLSPDGEEGYPGNCRVAVVYSLGDDNSLRLEYTVTTDKDTPVNVTNHSYFNLGGPENGSILGNEVMLNANRYTPVDSTLIPTGELKLVAGTPMDFRKPTAVGARIKEVGGHPVGYDHNFVINTEGAVGASNTDQPVRLAARIYEPKSGRIMEVSTTEPGVQFYSGNFLDGSVIGKKGVVYNQYWALVFETQHFPDSVNQPNFPAYVLKAGDTYHSTTFYRFSAK
jgi:aldose 1-epimerase